MTETYTILPAFFSLIGDRPDPALSVLTARCPTCESADLLQIVSHKRTTLPCDELDELTPNDPNHHWFRLRCTGCEGELLLEQCRGNAWVVRQQEDGRRVLVAGVPSCHEDYVYTCRHCGGPVHRRRKISGPASFTCWGCSGAVDSAAAYYRRFDEPGCPATRAEVRCGPCRKVVDVTIGSVPWHVQPTLPSPRRAYRQPIHAPAGLHRDDPGASPDGRDAPPGRVPEPIRVRDEQKSRPGGHGRHVLRGRGGAYQARA